MEFIKILLASALSYAAIFLSAKVIGHKQVSQLGFWDYITGITIGSIAAELATDLENMWKPLTAIAVYTLLSIVISLLNSRCMRARKYFNGAPTIILCGGKLYRKNMKKAKLDLSEFMVLCRQQGYFDLRSIHTAVYEYNGTLTILPAATARPVTPQDLSLSPVQETIPVEVILDGRILDDNLHRMGLNAAWLQKQLHARGLRSAKEVFLAQCDDKHLLTLYLMSA